MSRRVLVALLTGLLVVVGTGIAFATLQSSERHTDARAAVGQKSDQPSEEGEGVHGGTIERFHANCEVPQGADLTGNWTHGDYVSAWAATGDQDKIQAAAHSRCGKPAHAGQGKPAHAGQGKPAKEAKPGKRVGPPSKVSPPEPQPPTHA